MSLTHDPRTHPDRSVRLDQALFPARVRALQQTYPLFILRGGIGRAEKWSRAGRISRLAARFDWRIQQKFDISGLSTDATGKTRARVPKD